MAFRDEAFRSFNWVTYFQGMPPEAHTPFSNQWWFTDKFADGPRRMMDAFWAVPEWVPAGESHLVGSDSVVTKIAYGKGSVTYSTFDASSTDVLRLNFVPDSVWSGGKKLSRGNDLKQEGYTFDDATPARFASGMIDHATRMFRVGWPSPFPSSSTSTTRTSAPMFRCGGSILRVLLIGVMASGRCARPMAA